MRELYKYLAHTLGPKAENEEFLEKLATRVIRDYCYWRRNYFPQDPILLSTARKRDLEGDYNTIERQLDNLMAELRRTFPFYSPRYIAHQQSEVSLTSVVGFIAGLLYNPNNVTPESGAVTVDWEIEVCSEVMKMLGFRPPPATPKVAGDVDKYHKEIQQQFGWAHLSSGGTAANIEALWVARSVRYSALGFWAAAKNLGLDVTVRTPSGITKRLRNLSQRAAIGLKSNEIVYLHAKLLESLVVEHRLDPAQAQVRLDDAVKESGYGPGQGYGFLFGKFPPAILVSGAAHYSFKKAADVLGIGRDNVELVDMDQHFRLDPRALREALARLDRQGRIPVAVVGIVGTTEEGAIDPIHSIIDVKREREKKTDQSFWLHIDAAWGGFMRSLFRMKNNTQVFEKRLEELWRSSESHSESGSTTYVERFGELLKDAGDRRAAERFDRFCREGRYEDALGVLGNLRELLRLPEGEYRLRTIDRVNAVGDFVSETVSLRMGKYEREVNLRWAHWDIGSPILAMQEANSITIDPHKLGYTPYPIGMVAFSNDRVRRFIAEDAPYITIQGRANLGHQPPRHLSGVDEFGQAKSATSAFAPFTLEGSRPGAAASALWLSVRALPLDQENHGSLVRASLLAARSLHEWLKHWTQAMEVNGKDEDFIFLPLVEHAPDSNIVVFVVKKKASASIAACNRLSGRVYAQFSIRAELGEREYSYSQAFFLSNTTMKPPSYSFRALENFLVRSGFRDAEAEYEREGLLVLRATVQNPYITPLRTEEGSDVIRDFIMELDRAARQAVIAEVS